MYLPTLSDLLTSFQDSNLGVFLNAYFKAYGFDRSPTTITSTYLGFLIFTGLLNAFLLVRLITYYLILLLIPTAVLICAENTFWDIHRGSNFVELFKKSFTLYDESGMKKMVEMDIEKLRNEEGNFLVTEDFNENFYKFIVDHYLCKFHSHWHLTHLTTVFAYIQPTLQHLSMKNQLPVENCKPLAVPGGVKGLSWNRRTKTSLLGCKS